MELLHWFTKGFWLNIFGLFPYEVKNIISCKVTCLWGKVEPMWGENEMIFGELRKTKDVSFGKGTFVGDPGRLSAYFRTALWGVLWLSHLMGCICCVCQCVTEGVTQNPLLLGTSRCVLYVYIFLPIELVGSSAHPSLLLDWFRFRDVGIWRWTTKTPIQSIANLLHQNFIDTFPYSIYFKYSEHQWKPLESQVA